MLTIEQASTLTKLLGDKTRLTMVKLLEEERCCVCELTELFQMSQPAVSQHLKKLKLEGLVNEEKHQQWVFYSLNKEHLAYPLVSCMLSQIESQKPQLEALVASGKRITCCIN